MNILITNDDGYNFPGILALQKKLSKLGRAAIIAPKKDITGISQAISLFRTIKVNKHGDLIYSVEGFPVDCVGLALHGGLLDFAPDIVVSGINKGVNMGNDIWYSGTVGGARHAYIHGYKAISVSCDIVPGKDNYSQVADFIFDFIEFIMPRINNPFLFNINYPNHCQVKGVRWTQLGKRIYQDSYVKISNNLTNKDTMLYSFDGSILGSRDLKNSDLTLYNKGYISVTPLTTDATDHIELKKMQKIKLEDTFKTVSLAGT